MSYAHYLGRDCDHATLWDGRRLNSPPGRGGLVDTVVEIWGLETYLGGSFYEPASSHVVLDVGANIGLFSIWLSLCAKGIKVLAFEPFPENVEALRTNVRGFPNIHIHALAVGRERGAARMVPVGARTLDHQLDSSKPGETQVITLADAVERAGPVVDLLKMDIEGSEYDVFEVQPDPALMRRIRSIAIEWHEHVRPGVLSLLKSRLEPTHEIKFVNDDDPRYGMIFASLRRPLTETTA
jgi:FkbM family methyltransferase